MNVTPRITHDEQDEQVIRAQLRDTVQTANGPMVVVGRSFAVGTTSDEVARNVARPEFVSLSADGRPWVDAWHGEGASEDAVYVEKWSVGGCTFHGWVDVVSRRVVQAG